MSAQVLHVPRRLAIRLLAEAQKATDREVAGVVAARGAEPVTVYPATGREALASLADRGETLWAVYRSHPAAGWKPSAADLAASGHPEALHLIVSLDTKGVLQLRGWKIEGGEAVPKELAIGE